MERQDLFRDSLEEVHEDEVTLVVEVVLAALIYDPDQIVPGRSRIHPKLETGRGRQRRTTGSI